MKRNSTKINVSRETIEAIYAEAIRDAKGDEMPLFFAVAIIMGLGCKDAEAVDRMLASRMVRARGGI